MNPLAPTFNPIHRQPHLLHAEQLTKTETQIFQKVLREWTDIPTLDALLNTWTNYHRRNLSLLDTDDNIALLLLNISSLNRYLIDMFELVDALNPPIIVLNGTHHDEDANKKCASHLFNYHVHAAKGSNNFGGVLITVHKSLCSQRVTEFDGSPNLLVLDIGPDSRRIQLVTCYSPPRERIPFETFDRALRRNPNSIITGDLNAKHSSWSRSACNQKGRSLRNWLDALRPQLAMEIANKHVSTSTRSNATIDLILAPAHMSAGSASVLPHIGNDHYPVLWKPTLRLSSHHRLRPIKRTRWKLYECFLTFTGSYWQSLATTMKHSSTFFTLYERFLTLSLA